MTTRPAAVAGTFYPAGASELRATVASLLAGDAAEPVAACPKALIAPHAGFIYSGPVAASAYHLLAGAREAIRRVVVLGPAHRVYLRAMALPSVDVFVTPMGEIELDREAIDDALTLPHVVMSDDAHAQEHCIEVQLPFLQACLDGFRLVPVVVGDCPPDPVADLLERLWGGDDTLVVISSDLSHYRSYREARADDAATTAAIAARATDLTGEQACGAHAINGLMQLARRRGLEVRVLDVRNSGDTAGDRSRVVGYGAYALS